MPPEAWSRRWSQLAHAAGLAPSETLVLGLSGGADSVFLLHVLASAEERPHFTAVHVDHGLRGEAGRADARFCARLCSRLGVAFALRRVDLDPDAPGLEARAREARYRVLFDEARRLGSRAVLTGHHADDALETVLMRWIRGTELGGLAGLRASLELQPGVAAGTRRSSGQRLRPSRPLRVVRPLIHMRREEVRRLLTDSGLAWCEDSSNLDTTFTRNRLRHVLLPRLSELGGPGTLDNLRAFGAAVDQLESHLAGATAHLAWRRPPHAVASRPRERAVLGGTLDRADLMRLASPLRRRALWRLLLEGTGRAPRRRLLDLVVADVEAGRCATHALPRGFTLHLRAAELVCVPPRPGPPSLAPARQLRLAFEAPRDPAADAPSRGAALLPLPGEVRLADGRTLVAELVRRDAATPPPHDPLEVELDGERVRGELCVRFPRPGDRLRPLGAPGSRSLGRFLRDAGVPREERASVPLVLAGERIAWVAGVRPAEPFRVGPATRLRLHLRLLNGEAEPRAAPAPPNVESGVRQRELWTAGAS